MIAENWFRTRMDQTHPDNIKKLEHSLCAAANNLRTNSKRIRARCNMPVIRATIRRHANDPFVPACVEITADRASGKMAGQSLASVADGYNL